MRTTRAVALRALITGARPLSKAMSSTTLPSTSKASSQDGQFEANQAQNVMIGVVLIIVAILSFAVCLVFMVGLHLS